MSTPEQNSWATNIGGHLNLAVYKLIERRKETPKFETLEKCSSNSTSVQDYVSNLEDCGYHFTESQVLLQAIEVLGNDPMELISSWLIRDLLPRVQGLGEQIDDLEEKVSQSSTNLANLVQSLLEALAHNRNDGSAQNVEDLVCTLMETLSKWQKDSGNDCSDDDFVDLTPSPNRPSKELIGRVQIVKESLKDNDISMKLKQQTEKCEELASRVQALENKIENMQPALTALSDAPSMSTGTLTPTPTVPHGQVESRPNHHQGRRFLDMRIAICHGLDRRYGATGNNGTLLVRMYTDTPFKVLKTSLRKKYEHLESFELRLPDAHGTCLFDSDSPLTLAIEDGAEILYSAHFPFNCDKIIVDRTTTLDLTMPSECSADLQ